MREHSIVMPADLTMMFKALISLEGLGRQYDPEFKLVERLKPFLDEARVERYQPVALVQRGRANVEQFLGLMASGREARADADRSRSEAPRLLWTKA